MFDLILEIKKIEKYLYGEMSQEKILTNLPEFNKISRILNTIGFDRLKCNYIIFLKEEHSKDLKIIIDLYTFNESVSSSIIKQLWKIENLLTSRLAIMNNNNNLWKKMLDDKIKIFQNLTKNEQLNLIETINKKCSINNYKKGLIYAKSLRNKISHIDWSIIGKIEINKNDQEKVGGKKYFYLKDAVNILDEISGNEKYISDIFSKKENLEKLLIENYDII